MRHDHRISHLSTQTITNKKFMKKKNTKKSELSEVASRFASMGGRTTVKKYGKSHMVKIGKRGAEARWKNKK